MSANANAIAGGTIAIALIETLVEKQIITATDAKEILADAQSSIEPFFSVDGIISNDAITAGQIISDLLQRLPLRSV